MISDITLDELENARQEIRDLLKLIQEKIRSMSLMIKNQSIWQAFI